MLGEREANDLERSREYIAQSESQRRYRQAERREREKKDRVERGLEPQHWPANLLTEIFGPYTCPRCCSYLHLESDHGTGRG